MAYSAGTAYVQILPTLRGFGTSAETQISSALSGVGGQAGQQVGRQLGGGVDTGLSGTLRRLRSRFDELRDSGSDSMSALARGTVPVLDQLAKVSPVLGRVRDGFTSGQVAASAFSGAAGTVGGRLRTISDATGRVGAGFGSMATLSESALSRTGAAINRGLLAPVRGASTILAGYGLTAGTVFTGAGVAAMAMGVKFAASQEQAEMAFTTMLGSAQKAHAFVAQLQDFAARTPFDLPSVTTGAQRLMAFGFAAEDVLPTLTAIGDAVAGMGGSAEQINQVVLAIGQMSAKGKVQGDEILQLTEAGIPALRILANSYGTTTAAMQEMISDGLVPSSEAIPKLMAGIEQGTRGAAGQTQAFAGMMANQATTLTGIWSNFTDNANRALGQLVSPALPLIKTALGQLTTGLGALPDLIARFQNAARPVGAVVGATFRDISAFVTGSLVPSLRTLGAAVQPVAVIVGGALLAALRAAGSLLREVVGPALVTMSGWLRPLMPLIVGVAAAFLAWYAVAAAVGAVTKAIELVRGAILAVRIAWTLLSLAFTASPIGLIIALVAGLVAGIIYAWNNFEGFRAVVLAVWSAIQTAAQWAYENVLRPAFDGIVTGARAVGEFFTWLWQVAIGPALQAIAGTALWLWQNVLSPVFSFIGLAARVLAAIVITILVTPFVLAFRALAAVAQWLWSTVLQPIFGFIGDLATWLYAVVIKPAIDGIVAYFRLWAAIGIWLWQNVLQPTLGAIGDFFGWLWRIAIKPAIDGIVTAIQWLGSAATWLWTNAVQPALNGIGTVITWLWRNVALPTFGLLRDGLSALGSAFTWVYQNVIKPAWDALGTALRWVYDHAISPAFEATKSAVRSVGQAFSSAVDWIKNVWDGIKKIAAVPANFVINEVYNHGIRAVWNWVADFLGLGKLAEAKPIAFAGGGILPGYAPGRDIVPALLSPGESVLTPEATRMVGARNVLALNAAASGRPATVVGAGVPRFAGGGVVGSLLSFVEGIGENVVDLFTDPVAWIKGHIGFGDSPWISMLAKAPGELIGKAVDWLWEKINPFSSGGGVGTSGGDLDGWIKAAMGFTAVPANWYGPLRTLIMRESGGNPRAHNNWDSNARRGDPSRGLMQTIGATFNAYRDKRLSADIFDPIANIVAGINYIKARYGSIFNVQQAVGSTPRGYDTGGWLPPGMSTVYNGTGKPEAVFTAEQFDLISRAADRQDQPHITVYARTDADPEHIAHSVDRHLALGARL
ncbi:tape measure protein [Amycolatopsis pittospori]|uniref:tape measure protein n=1 Tax=Amycolatopsis pittospori TaxID=2749434 RepID=UPI0015F0C0F3|nr:tape measure protein [Amycolatopsis pittospori]